MAGCTATQDLPRDYTMLPSGTTPRGIKWYVQAGVNASKDLALIDANANDLNWPVIIVEHRFRAGPDFYIENGVYDGLTVAIPPRRIYFAHDFMSAALVRHEYNHVRLFNETGSGDPDHKDPSWINFQVD